MYYKTKLVGENMGEILITFIKQSSAYNLKRAAARMGIYTTLVQTPKEISENGCSYGVSARRQDAQKLLSVCRNNGIKYMRVLVSYRTPDGKKIYTEF